MSREIQTPGQDLKAKMQIDISYIYYIDSPSYVFGWCWYKNLKRLSTTAPLTLVFPAMISASSNQTLPSNWEIDDEEPMMLISPTEILYISRKHEEIKK